MIGTWSKTSDYINSRAPLRKDPSVDYTQDPENDWVMGVGEGLTDSDSMSDHDSPNEYDMTDLGIYKTSTRFGSVLSGTTEEDKISYSLPKTMSS